MQLGILTPLYFVGWNYHEPSGVPLKRLLMNPASPFEVKAIVHQVVMAPDVDGVPVIQNDEFLALAKTTKLQAVLLVKDDFSRSVWLRRGREVGIEWLDEGELLLQAEKSMRTQGKSVDLGVLTLPEAFDHELLQLLRPYEGAWLDAASNCVFRAYLQFLETGVLGPMRSTSVFNDEHPMRQTGKRSISANTDALGGGIAWEIATHRSSFLEQVVLVSGKQNWRYAYSSNTLKRGTADVESLQNLLTPLGIRVAASWLEFDAEGYYLEHCISGFDLAICKNLPCFVRIDVDQPLKVVDRFYAINGQLRAWVRVGRRPKQLLDLLQNFPIDNMTLDCDRPGPLGLQVRLKSES